MRCDGAGGDLVQIVERESQCDKTCAGDEQRQAAAYSVVFHHFTDEAGDFGGVVQVGALFYGCSHVAEKILDSVKYGKNSSLLGGPVGVVKVLSVVDSCS